VQEGDQNEKNNAFYIGFIAFGGNVTACRCIGP